ncbi:MAG TPA: prepilin-type N-terminal cleavage/methylation domain-containing protein [Candidatus Dormibacteraeota bacterium]|nr:prepilin-type N-terminal cleavage/methylation domain-containing protein [Candidatus Dormibacteraeota bacterium]
MERLINRATRQRRNGEQGFTLIELLVVIAVLAILAAIVIFNVTGVTNRGSSSACVTDLKSVQTASDAYKNDTGSYALLVDGVTLDSSKLAPTYLHTWPSEKTWAINAGGTVTTTCP